MSDVSDEEDSIDKIDFSVISTALETSGNTLDQILNAVHYGTPELRHLLRESCDFIFECKYCKNLFRAIPNFIAHKRIYCGEKSFFPRPVPKKKKKKEEVVVVRPVSPSLSAADSSQPQEGQKTVLEQILTGDFQGNSESYKHYTEAAENVEKHKMNMPTTGVKTSSIQNTNKAVNVEIVSVPESHSETASNANTILAKAKKLQKPPLTKIVDGLKKSAKTTSNVSKVVNSAPKTSTPVASPKKMLDKKAVSDSSKAEKTIVKSNLNTSSPQKMTSKMQSRIIANDGKKLLDKAVALEQMIRKGEPPSVEKSPKVVLKPLLPMMEKSEKELVTKSITGTQESKSTSTSTAITTATEKKQTTSTAITIATEKKQTSKLTSTNDLRPVKTQNGSELSELSQLGHCDLKQLKCLICNLQYSQKKTLLQHMHVIHSGSKTKYPCNICQKTFDYFWGLTRHLLLNHKKTKEEIDKMRGELRALAYTETDDLSSSQKGQSEKQNTTSRTQQVKTLVKMSSCQGCQKSFWKKSNYEEHMKQCRFLSTMPSPSQEVKSSETTKENVLKSLSRRQRVLDKLAESRKTKENLEENDDSHSEKSGHSSLSSRSLRNSNEKAETSKSPKSSSKKEEEEGTENEDLLKTKSQQAACKRLRIAGKFVSREKAKKLAAMESGNDAEKEKRLNSNKNKVVKKLKEKSRSFVPTQRFISTRRSAEFYHSPAQRTRFHDKRRAVVESPKKDSRSPSKTPTKVNLNDTVPNKQSPEEKSELELARRNLLNAINKGKNIEKESSPEKVSRRKGSAVQRRSTEKSRKSNSGSKDNSFETDRSRPTRRNLQINSDKSASKLNSRTPSRDTSVDSVGSRQSSRSRRDVSVESVRSRQSDISTRSQQNLRSISVESFNRTRQSFIAPKSELNEQQDQKNKGRSKGETIESKDSKTVIGNNETCKNVSKSRDSSRESITTRSNENLSDVDSRSIKKLSESKDVLGKRSSPNSEKLSTDKDIDGNLKKDNKNTENHYGTRLSEKASQENTGKDEIDGLGSSSKSVQKEKPKWSSKNWNSRKSGMEEDNDNTNVEKQTRKENVSENTVMAKGQIKKSETEKEPKVIASKVESAVDKGKLKGIEKPKIMKRRPRYPTRLLRTRLQVMKKSGDVRKRYPSRMSGVKQEETNTNKVKMVKDTQKKKISSEEHTNDQAGKSTNVKVREVSKPVPESQNEKQSPISATNNRSANSVNSNKRRSVGKVTKEDNIESQVSSQSKTLSNEKIDAGQQADIEKETKSDNNISTCSHRQRHSSDAKGVKVIEEIWVSKEPGQPLQLSKCKKTIIDSPKKVRSTRMYVVDPVKPEKPKCMDFSRINHLVDYKKNKCLQCGLELTDISSLRRHAVRHLGWKRYKCKLCAYTGFNRSECNSHIKRRHADKLVSSSCSISTFIIDLNKEASNVRNKKKQSTLQKKNNGNTKSEQASKSSQGRVISLRKRTRKTESEAEDKDSECKETGSSSIVPSVLDETPKVTQVGRKTRSLSGHQSTSTSPQTGDIDDNSKLTRKRKRAVSEEVPSTSTKTDEESSEKLKGEDKNDSRMEEEESKADNDEWIDEDIGSVSDYDASEDPPRDVVSPTFIKMNPNVALMMATLEAARATKFSRGKRGRGGIRRFSSPLKKHPRLSTDDQDEEDEELQSLEDKRDGVSEAKQGEEESKTGEKSTQEENDGNNLEKSSTEKNEEKPSDISKVDEKISVNSVQISCTQIKNENGNEQSEVLNTKTGSKQSKVLNVNTGIEELDVSNKCTGSEQSENSNKKDVENEESDNDKKNVQSEILLTNTESESSGNSDKNAEIEQSEKSSEKTDTSVKKSDIEQS